MRKKMICAGIFLAPFVFSLIYGALAAHMELLLGRTGNAPVYFAAGALVFLTCGGIIAFIGYYIAKHRTEGPYLRTLLASAAGIVCLALYSWLSFIPWVFNIYTYLILFLGAYLLLAVLLYFEF